MNRRSALLLPFFALQSSTAFGDSALDTTFGLLNGKFWIAAATSERKTLIVGSISDALRYMRQLVPNHVDASSQKAFKEWADVDLQVALKEGQIIDGIDAIFADPANRILPIIEAYSLVCQMINNGWNPEQARLVIGNLRDLYSKHVQNGEK